MNEKMRSWVTGLMLGQFSSPLPMAQKEPERQLIGYSYNGVVLPDINEVWTNKETYPYATISKMAGEYGYLLICIDRSAVALEDGTVVVNTYPWNSTTFICSDGGSWVHDEDYTNGTTPSIIVNPTYYLDALVWAKADVLNPDGSVYLAASEPVPVYE